MKGVAKSEVYRFSSLCQTSIIEVNAIKAFDEFEWDCEAPEPICFQKHVL